jgi:hypothetical protein
VFLVKDSSESREERIKQFLSEDPALAALLSVIHFEWTVRRAIIALGDSPNIIVRQKLDGCHGHKAYKELWKQEVAPRREKTLPVFVAHWDGLLKAFKLRHILVHGVQSCGSEYATERAEWAIEAAKNVREFCSHNNVAIDARLPVRRQRHI